MNDSLDPECNTDQLAIVQYEPDTRNYSFIIRYYDCESYGVRLSLFYCPWRCKKVPDSLGEQWGEVLENE